MDRFDKVFSVRWAYWALFPAVLVATLPSGGGAQLPPDEEWRTLETPHFRVTYPDGLLDLAQRAGDRGETAWDLLTARFLDPPTGKVDLLVSDHADVSNGYAQVFPSNRIVVFAPPPVDGFTLAHMDEWMELVITHELVHIFQQDLSLGLGGALRGVFGRVPLRWPFFPGLATPGWTVEGIPTYYESALTEAGRVRGSFHEMVVRTSVLEDALESLDQVSGGSPVWPGPERYYIYGSLYFEYLVERHGEAALTDFVRKVAGQWIPFRMNAAAREAFGLSFSESWEEWTEELEAEYRALADSLALGAPLTEGETLTGEGYYALNPAPSPGGREVLFSRQDGRSDYQIRLLDPDGKVSTKLARTNRLANLAWTPEGEVLFSQTEFTDSYRVRGDLYLLREDGSEVRLTRGSRLDHPSVHPSGRRAVAVQEEGGTNRLVTVDLPGGAIHPMNDYEPQVHWAYPRWSPNGRWIAVARWTPGANFDLVLLDEAGEVIRQITSDRAIDNSPAWSPDGRWLLWASDRSGIPNLHAVPFDPDSGESGSRLQVTNMLGGAGYPAVDPKGEWVYYAGYHHDGWHLERIPFDPGSWFSPFPLHQTFHGEVDPSRYGRKVQSPQGEYDPLSTLAPTYWAPAYRIGDDAGGVQVLKPGWGISTSGTDLVERHSYYLRGTYSGEPGGFEGGASYSYAGLGNPVLTLSATQSLDAEGPLQAPDESGDLLYVVERERALDVSATLLRRRTRNVSWVTLSGGHIWEHQTLLEGNLQESDRFYLNRPNARMGDLRLGLGLATARTFPMSISPEDGVGIYLRGRSRWDLALADSLKDVPRVDRSLMDLIGEVKLYKGLRLPGFGNHVLAFRGSGGAGSGPGADRYHFEVGGASGGGIPLNLVDLGYGLLFPLRGYGTARRTGRYAWSATAEYRFPLRLVNRGPGLFPLHLDWLSGALFVDGGNAWGPRDDLSGHDNPRGDPLLSVGGELMVRMMPLWYGAMDLRFGVAAPLVEGDGARAYVRLGPAF